MNLNITNRYTIDELYKTGKVETVIISPEISFDAIREIGKVKARKAILGYSTLKGMHIELSIFNKDKEIIKNNEGDIFTAVKTLNGNTEIYLERPLNILNDIWKLSNLMIDEVVLEFNLETPEEVSEVLENMKRKNRDI